jgi:hypothetical protein
MKERERFNLNQCNDRLGKQVIENVQLLHDCKQNWARYVRAFRTRSHFHPEVGTIDHPAAQFLDYLRTNGAPIRMKDENWTKATIQERATRGPHQSTKAHIEFVRDEMADFDDKSFWTVLPLEAVQHLPNLRISPLGCVPQRDRRPRLINDLTFYGINENTICLAPTDAMQFGRALERVLHKIQSADPRHGPVYLSKIDVADGFYRVDLETATAPTLAVILPHQAGEPPLVAILLSLPMGWVESPPYFCAASETIADLANANIHKRFLPHRLDALADTPPPSQLLLEPYPINLMPSTPQPTGAPREPASEARPRKKLAYVDVYMDDFLGLCQGDRRERTRVRRALLYAIDQVLAPLDSNLHPQHNEPASVKKMLKGDACWATTKVMLGWLIDTVNKTIMLPPHRVVRLLQIFDSLCGKKRVSLNNWHRVVGELRSMVLAIPGGQGLFNALQYTLVRSEKHRVRITQDVRDALEDFELLGCSIASRPTRLAEIVPAPPSCVGAHYASGLGAGGVWFTPTRNLLWRQPFPPEVASKLVSFSNPTGVLTNSDFEQASGVWHHMVLAHQVDIREQTVHSLCDNTPAVSRFKKGSTTTRGAPAYLNRLLALHQRCHRYLSRHDYIPGSANAMADDASRLWHLSDEQLLTHFSQLYPQAAPWELVHLPPPLVSPVISSLLGKRSNMRSPLDLRPPPPPAGPNGPRSAPKSESNAPCNTSRTQSLISSSSPSVIETDPSQKTTTRSEALQWLMSSDTSVRRWPFWGMTTPGSFLLGDKSSA